MIVHSASLRTWSYLSPAVEQVDVLLSSNGRPFDADIELWHGPDNTPCKMRVYVENGQLRPFSAVVETPRGPNTVAIRNRGQLELPVTARVVAVTHTPSEDCISCAMTIQGGALRTYPFDPFVDSVQVLLKTDGRPLNARIELLQGPNNNKQVIELYTEDGCDRPFFCVLETPGSGNVVRIVNTAPVEFPMTASAVPNSYNEGSTQAVLGGDGAFVGSQSLASQSNAAVRGQSVGGGGGNVQQSFGGGQGNGQQRFGGGVGNGQQGFSGGGANGQQAGGGRGDEQRSFGGGRGDGQRSISGSQGNAGAGQSFGGGGGDNSGSNRGGSSPSFEDYMKGRVGAN